MMISTHLVDLTIPGSRVDLYSGCLQLRRDVFITNMGWNLHQAHGCEFDQYDIPASIHIAATEGDELVGCIRLLRTDSQHSGTTYMILDAHRGKIPNLPGGILEEEVISRDAWEASRLAISPTVPAECRNALLVDLINAGRSHIMERGGATMLGMMSPVFLRVFRRAGFNVHQFGPVAEQRDGKICVLRWDFLKQ